MKKDRLEVQGEGGWGHDIRPQIHLTLNPDLLLQQRRLLDLDDQLNEHDRATDPKIKHVLYQAVEQTVFDIEASGAQLVAREKFNEVKRWLP